MSNLHHHEFTNTYLETTSRITDQDLGVCHLLVGVRYYNITGSDGCVGATGFSE